LAVAGHRPGLAEGEVSGGLALSVAVESGSLVAFGDGVEADALTVAWGQTLRLRVAARRLRLLR
jgi:hypothetical protein